MIINNDILRRDTIQLMKQIDKQIPNFTVAARFDLTAFYVSAEKLQGQPAPKAPAGGPAPAAAPAQQPAK